jgi:hypothetical protein
VIPDGADGELINPAGELEIDSFEATLIDLYPADGANDLFERAPCDLLEFHTNRL